MSSVPVHNERTIVGPGEGSLLEFLLPLAQAWGRLVIVPLLIGSAAVGASFLVAPTYQASTTLLPPQPPQSAAANALASLGALGALAGLPLGGGRSQADLYVSLMQSVNATDRLIDKFKLIEAYELKQRWQAQRELANNTVIGVGKKDGLITVAVEDTDPRRAADMANQYVEELRRLTSELAVTEAQERRAFFETQLKRAKDNLTAAQTALQASGFTLEALKAEPKAAAEGYAKLRAELTAAEVKLQAMRSAFTDTTPEVRALQDTVIALRGQLARSEAERQPQAGGGADYVSKYREFKYQEMLYELMARQFEIARVDESRQGMLIQVVDVAKPPERKLRPKRAYWGIIGSVLAFLVYATVIMVRARLRIKASEDPPGYARWLSFKSALGLRRRA